MKNLTLLICFLIAGASLMAQSAVSTADAPASKKAVKVETVTAEEAPAAVMAPEDAPKAAKKGGCASKSSTASKACCASKGDASASKMSATHVNAGVADDAASDKKSAGCADKAKASGKSCCASKGGAKADTK